MDGFRVKRVGVILGRPGLTSVEQGQRGTPRPKSGTRVPRHRRERRTTSSSTVVSRRFSLVEPAASACASDLRARALREWLFRGESPAAWSAPTSRGRKESETETVARAIFVPKSSTLIANA